MTQGLAKMSQKKIWGTCPPEQDWDSSKLFSVLHLSDSSSLGWPGVCKTLLHLNAQASNEGPSISGVGPSVAAQPGAPLLVCTSVPDPQPVADSSHTEPFGGIPGLCIYQDPRGTRT